MLRRRGSESSSSTWRSRFRLVRGAAAALAAAVVVSGCIDTSNNVAGVSDTCTQPATLNDGFFANRAVFFRVGTQADPLDPSTTWICYRLKAPGQPEQGGRIDVNPTSEAPGVRVTNDTASRACTTTPENTVPGPHPIEQGEVLNTPFYLDAWADLTPWTTQGVSGGAWVCVEAGAVKQRIAIDLGTLNDPDVLMNTDTAPPPVQDTTPPPAGKASSACAAGTFGPSTELVNAHLSGRDLFLYTAQPANDQAHVCARLSSPQGSGGVRLSVKAATSQIVDIQQSGDITPCTQDVVVLSNPSLAIRTSPAGQLPASVCVNATRFTVLAGPVPPVVTFALDS